MGTFTGAIGTGGKWLLDRSLRLLPTGINPNLLTFFGLVATLRAASFAVGNFAPAQCSSLAGFGHAGWASGAPANRVTAFGASLVIQRWIVTRIWRSMGLLVYYSVSGRTPYVILAAVATAGSVMVSYARAWERNR
jgi:hypothetical protein